MAEDWPHNPQAELMEAVRAFKAEFPEWWWSLGECSVSCDASCGPDRQGRDAWMLKHEPFDEGFHADLPWPSTLAEALRDVAEQARAAVAAFGSCVSGREGAG